MPATGVIVATTNPLTGVNTQGAGGPVVDPLPVLNDLSATTSFTIPTAENTVLASFTGQPGAVYSISPDDGRVKVVSGKYVRGSAAYTTAGTTIFTLTETFTNTLGQSVSRNSTLTLTAVAPVVVVPGLATVADGIGRRTRTGVKIGQIPAGASLSGTNSTHFTVDALGQVAVSAAGQTAGLAATYSMTVVGGGAVNAMAFSTIAGAFTANNSAEILTAFNFLKTELSTDHAIVLPTGTRISSRVKLENAVFSGTIVDANKNLTPQDIDPKGFDAAGNSLWAGLNGKQAYDPNAVASISGGSLKIYCPTTLDTGGAKMDCLVHIVNATPIWFDNIDFCRMSAVDMYDTRASAPYIVDREAVITVTAVNAGKVVTVNFDDKGAGYQPGYVYSIQHKSGAGGNFAAKAIANNLGELDPATLTVSNSGANYVVGSKVYAFNATLWDPPQYTAATVAAANNANPDVAARTAAQDIMADFPGNKFYQVFANSAVPGDALQDTVSPDFYLSLVFRRCRWGIGGRSDVPSVLRYNRCLNIVSHNHLVIEDCLFDGMWISIGHTRFVRTDMRRNAHRNYTNDIIDTYPTTADQDNAGSAAATAAARAINPNAAAVTVRFSTLPAPFRGEGLMIVTDNYVGPPDQNDLRFSNSHSDGHQHGAGGDLERQNILFANNTLNMNCSSLYITTQGYFDNGNSTAWKRAKIKFNFCAASTTNSLNFSFTDPNVPQATLLENNFSTRTIYGTPDLGGGTDFIGGAANPMGLVFNATIRRNVLKEVWDMGPGNGGRISFNPPGGVMMGQLSSTPSPTSTEPRTYRPDPTNQPTYRVPTGDIYISDNFFLGYLTPNTGAENSYPEIFKGLNAAGQGPAFVWDNTLVAGKPALGYQHWWNYVRDTPSSRSWTDTWAAMNRGKADIQSIFTPKAGSGADGRMCFPAATF